MKENWDKLAADAYDDYGHMSWPDEDEPTEFEEAVNDGDYERAYAAAYEEGLAEGRRMARDVIQSGVTLIKRERVQDTASALEILERLAKSTSDFEKIIEGMRTEGWTI